MPGRRTYIERQRLVEAERERLRADMLQHERDLLSLRFKELDAQQKTVILMVGELRKEVMRMGKMLVEAIINAEPVTPEARNHAAAIVRDFVIRQPCQGAKGTTKL